ncbi:MAG: hypothetical protein M9928_21010, partial [Anaerolineae bacterium]|nr:hypothetical protein [Anaerolineae bacterium]
PVECIVFPQCSRNMSKNGGNTKHKQIFSVRSLAIAGNRSTSPMQLVGSNKINARLMLYVRNID